jgi:hypothetical protein
MKFVKVSPDFVTLFTPGKLKRSRSPSRLIWWKNTLTEAGHLSQRREAGAFSDQQPRTTGETIMTTLLEEKEPYMSFGVALRETQPRPREAVLATRPLDRQGRIGAYGLNFYTVHLPAGETMRVWGAGEGDIDIYVYDRFGALVAFDNTDGCTPSCEWVTLGTGEYLVKVVNNEGFAVDYQVRAG